jgi:Leucine-rich repeat (LRR) protein
MVLVRVHGPLSSSQSHACDLGVPVHGLEMCVIIIEKVGLFYLDGTSMPDRVLNLWRQNLGAVPDEIWNDPEITVLILADNDLRAISSRIGELQHLRTLDLGHNQLVELPVELGNLTAITDFLYLHDNQLESLPRTLERLQELRYLNISNNRFLEFPEQICQMSSLVELRATDNQFSGLPISIGKLSRLRELHLRNNRLQTLPSTIGELSELRLLDLRGNPIETLPESILAMPRLEKIDLRWINTLQAPPWLDRLEDRGCLIYR